MLSFLSVFASRVCTHVCASFLSLLFDGKQLHHEQRQEVDTTVNMEQVDSEKFAVDVGSFLSQFDSQCSASGAFESKLTAARASYDFDKGLPLIIKKP